MIMPRKKTSLPFEEAREFIHSEVIGSRSQYTDWHKANKPKQIPRYPPIVTGKLVFFLGIIIFIC